MIFIYRKTKKRRNERHILAWKIRSWQVICRTSNNGVRYSSKNTEIIQKNKNKKG